MLTYDAGTNTVVSRTAVPSTVIRPPAVLVRGTDSEPNPLRWRQVTTPLGTLSITRVSQVAGEVRLGLNINTPAVAGKMVVTARQARGTPPPPQGRLANWTWGYRDCREETALALMVRIENRAEPGVRFPGNADTTLELCVPSVIDARGQRNLYVQFGYQWTRLDGSIIPGFSGRIVPQSAVQLVVTISLSAFETLHRRLMPVAGPIAGPPDPRLVEFFDNPGFLVLRSTAGRRLITLPSLQGVSLEQGSTIDQLRVLSCNAPQLQPRTWNDIFERNRFRRSGPNPDPYILVNRLLDAPIRSQLPRLTLPVRNSGQLLSLERRSVEALFGQGAPNPYAFAGLGPSNLDKIPPHAASPRGLARIPRRP